MASCALGVVLLGRVILTGLLADLPLQGSSSSHLWRSSCLDVCIPLSLLGNTTVVLPCLVGHNDHVHHGDLPSLDQPLATAFGNGHHSLKAGSAVPCTVTMP